MQSHAEQATMTTGVNSDSVKTHGRQAGLFAFVGVFNTATDFAVYAGLVALGLAPALANGASFLAANLQSYFVNSALTFRRGGKAATRSFAGYGRFVSAHLLGLAISTVSILLLSGHFGPYLAKVAALGLTFASNYLMSAFFVFRRPTRD